MNEEDRLRVKVLVAKMALEELVEEVNLRHKEFKPFSVLVELDFPNYVSNHLCVFENSFSELSGLLVTSCPENTEGEE